MTDQFPDAEIIAAPRSREWYESRRMGIGASECAAAIGLSPWETPLHVYRRKVGEDPEKDNSDDMLTGRIMEGSIIRLFRHKQGVKVQTRRPPMLRSLKWPWLLATPDAVTVTPDLIECKNTNQFDTSEWGKPGTDEIPSPALVQVQHQMAVSGLMLAFVPVLIRGRYSCYRVQRNDRFIANIVEATREFWRLVENATPPDPTWDHSATLTLVKSMFGVDGSTVDLSDAAKLSWADYEALGKESRELDKQRDAIKAKILAEMKDAQFGLLGDGRMVRRQRITVQEYTVPTQTRVDVRAVKVPKDRPVLTAE